MAEKSFGVKEVNLIGASGTPTITSPNNLNLNAVNVAISTNVSIGGTLSVTGNISIGGTLTYEDVTNIDSVGVVTAREGIIIPDNKVLSLGNRLVGSTAGDLRLYHDTNNSYIDEIGSGNLFIRNGSNNSIFCQTSGTVQLYYNGNDKLATSNTGVTVSGTLVATGADINGDIDVDGHTNLDNVSIAGVVTATTFSGSGASLTNLPLSNTDVQVLYTVTANGSSAYRFAGNGIVSTEDNPDVYLIRGLKYRFVNNSGGSHPFQIRESSGGSAYSAGVTNNGASSGNIDFQVPYSAPSHLYYQCTSHGGMVGNLYIRGAGGQNTNVGVTTFSGDVYLGNDIYLTNGSGGYEQVEVGANDIRVEHKHIHSEFGVWVRSTSVTDRKNGIDGDGNDLLLYSNTTSKVRITSDGDMGLGTGSNTVTQRLDVRESSSTVFNASSNLPTIARLYNTSSTNGASAGLQLRTDNNAGAAGIQYIHAVNSSTNYDSDLVFSRRLATSGSYAEACRITNAGNLKFPSGKGIDFSATGDSAGNQGSSELFDDYEEGTWTPAFKAGNNSTACPTTVNEARYTKVGRLVTATAYFTMSSYAAGGTGGDTRIVGLPYVNIGQHGAANVHYFNGLNTNVTFMSGTVQGSSYEILIRGTNSANSSTSNLDFDNHFGPGDSLIISATYYTT